MRHIALVTARQAIDLDEDLQPLATALSRLGATAHIVCWDDPGVGWHEYEVAVIRSAWDYPERLAGFIRWARLASAETRLMNPLGIVEWNADKRYLAELADAGIRTVPTVFAAPGDEIAWPSTTDVVVKPSVSAGSRDTARFGTSDITSARSLVEAIWSSGRTVMIQPYLDAVDRVGELGLVSFEGRHSHTFRKGPLLRRGAAPTPDLFAAEEITPANASTEARRLADAAIGVVRRATGEVPLYARVDLVDDNDGPLLLELELIEPSVYHSVDPASAERFGRAILGQSTN